MTWDPTRRATVVVRELDCSRDETGAAQATITLRPWGTRERLKYQDDSTRAVELVMQDDGQGQQVQMRKVRPSVLSLLHLSLTVVASTGFPPGFDFANRDDVESLAEEVFDEVVALALAVQPIPDGRGIRKPADRKAATPPPDVPAETAADFDDTVGAGEAADPSPTPSTPAV